MNLAAWVERQGRSRPQSPALALGTTMWSDWRGLAARAAALAGGLRAAPFACQPGDRVAIVMTNRPEFLEALFAIWHAGLVAVPVNARLHPAELDYVFAHSGARLALVSPDLEAALAAGAAIDRAGAARLEVVVAGGPLWRRLVAAEPAPLVPREPHDPAWLFYTSGTTGRPKGASLTHRNLLMMTLSYFADVEQVLPSDAVLHAAPLSHGSGLYGLPHVAKGAVSVIPESGHFDPAEVAALLAAWPGTAMFAAPTMVRRMIGHAGFAAADHRGLKTLVYGGAPMYVEDLKAALGLLGPRLVQIYGQGEAPMTIAALSKAQHDEAFRCGLDHRLASAGLARTDVELRIVDADGRPLPTGVEGEIACRGDVVMAGYWADDAATSRTIRDGWLHTGDVGLLDEAGFLTLKDRSKDVIISGGSNIYPREVEDVLLHHPGVAEVSVIGQPSRDWGEEVVAFVAPLPGAVVTAAELDGLCLASIARFKRPKAYVFVDALPKSEYGKILKTELRKRLASPA